MPLSLYSKQQLILKGLYNKTEGETKKKNPEKVTIFKYQKLRFDKNISYGNFIFFILICKAHRFN